MGVGFYLTGRHGDSDPSEESDSVAGTGSERWLGRVEAWIREHGGESLEGVGVASDSEGNPAVFANLHPSAENLEIIVPEPGRVVVSAKTSTVGPGYHIHVCDLLHRLGEALEITWDEPDNASGTGDETGYFHGGDASGVEAEFLAWVGQVASLVVERLEEDYAHLMISMPMGHHYPHHGPLVTPLGPRDLNWLFAVAADPRQGIDLFPWWTKGYDAQFYLGRALCRMWKDVRWRAPLNEEEGNLLLSIHRDLARAYQRDSSLAYPWAEWRELLDQIEIFADPVPTEETGVELEVTRRAGLSLQAPRIGYRRLPVRVNLSEGWSIEVPGTMAEAWDDEGNWSGWDGHRTVWFTSFTLARNDGGRPDASQILADSSQPEGELLEHCTESVIGEAVFEPYEEDGQPLWRLAARSAVEGGLGVCNIVVEDESDRDWAISVWHSLEHA